MSRLKNVIHDYFGSFVFFYSYLRYRIFISVLFSLLVGVLDGFGLAMFLPLLQMVTDKNAVLEKSSMGNMGFLVDLLQSLGIGLHLLSILILMVFFFSVKGLLTYFGSIYKVQLQQLFIKGIKLNLLNSFSTISFISFTNFDIGRIQNTLSGEVDRVARAYDSYFLALQQFIMVMVYMIFVFYIDFKFALLVSIGGVMINLLFKVIYAKTKSASKAYVVDSNFYQGQIIQLVTNYKYLRATGLMNTFKAKLKNTIDFVEYSRLKIGTLSSVLRSFREPILVLVVATVILIQNYLLDGNMATILLSLLFFFRALTSIMAMQTAWNYFLEYSGSLENVNQFQKELASNQEQKGTGDFKKFESQICLSALDFSYGTTSILTNLTYDFYKNKTYAFVGESGSGKTTLVNIIAGLIPVKEGTIAIDKRDYAGLDLTQLQHRIGYITQEPVIFTDTIFNNVTLWEEKTAETIQKFRAACEQASLYDFIETLPLQEDTVIENNGVNLSGGQKQRVSIARELYKEIDILIMDEATSALDSETEAIIQQNIERLKGHYTIFIVAHRLSTIKNADVILLMKKGAILSDGSFQELLEKEPIFKKMVEANELN